MPGFDGTGPAGRGPGTGGGFVICGAKRLGLGNARGSRWYGYGRGANQYYGGSVARRSYGMPAPEDEKIQLEMQIEQLKAELAETERRMTELK